MLRPSHSIELGRRIEQIYLWAIAILCAHLQHRLNVKIGAIFSCRSINENRNHRQVHRLHLFEQKRGQNNCAAACESANHDELLCGICPDRALNTRVIRDRLRIPLDKTMGVYRRIMDCR